MRSGELSNDGEGSAPVVAATGSSSHSPRVPDHKLLTQIGRGSYGEVWMARNSTDTLRAVKIVRRDTFENDRPYEREFNGLRNFEPLSRAHEGLVDILHVGRSDDDSFFYYVMELADDASGGAGTASILEVGSYRPVTLESRIRTAGRLPAKECLSIAIIIAEALKHLHDNGLVHRDIKPSNIIFVQGVPKLADVGLVSTADSPRSFVGTEGFVPPEGPGSMPADIYSLGKCLYEAVMGKDRLAFPSPPTDIDGLPDRKEIAELNEVILRCCAPSLDERYARAELLLADLRLIHNGLSPSKIRRRRAQMKWGLVTLTLLLLAAGLQHVLSYHPKLGLVREFTLQTGGPAYHSAISEAPDGGLAVFTVASGKLWTDLLSGKTNPPPLPLRGGGHVLRHPRDWTSDGGVISVRWRDDIEMGVTLFEKGRMGRTFSAPASLTTPSQASSNGSFMMLVGYIPALYDMKPRGLFGVTYGYETGSRRLLRLANLVESGAPGWEIETPSIGDPHVSVNANSKTPMLFVGTYACDNQYHTAEGLDDEHSYLLGISLREGTLLWARTNGGTYIDTIPLFAELGGRPCVLTRSTRTAGLVKISDGTLKSEGAIRKWSPDGDLLASWTSTHALCDFTVAPGQASMGTVLVTDDQGTLHVFDSNLRPIKEIHLARRAFSWVRLAIAGVNDLDGDGQSEIVLISSQVKHLSGVSSGRVGDQKTDLETSDDTLHVLDGRFRVRSSFVFWRKRASDHAAQAHILPPTEGGARQILIMGETVQVFGYGER